MTRKNRISIISSPLCRLAALLVVLQSLLATLVASENVPHAPFAQFAEVLEPGQFVGGLTFQSSEAYQIWAGKTHHDVTVKSDGESYGIDITQGYLTLQYGISSRWAADVSIGVTTVGWRYFANYAPSGRIQSTEGLMDSSIGVRYQIFNELGARSHWVPTVTFRAGAVLPGTYNEDFPFAPGNRSAAIEPEIFLRKHFGWAGLGVYGDGLFRWNSTTHNDQYIISAGFFQQIMRWELQAGYRRLGATAGEDIVLNSDHTIDYPRNLRESNHAIEAGFNYTTPKKHIQFGFYSRAVLDGINSDQKLWFGAYVNFPLGHSRPIDFSHW